jgi:hypothetical protein
LTLEYLPLLEDIGNLIGTVLNKKESMTTKLKRKNDIPFIRRLINDVSDLQAHVALPCKEGETKDRKFYTQVSQISVLYAIKLAIWQTCVHMKKHPTHKAKKVDEKSAKAGWKYVPARRRKRQETIWNRKGALVKIFKINFCHIVGELHSKRGEDR